MTYSSAIPSAKESAARSQALRDHVGKIMRELLAATGGMSVPHPIPEEWLNDLRIETERYGHLPSVVDDVLKTVWWLQ